MIDVLNVYACPKCGKVLSDQMYQSEIIDTDNDDVYIFLCCTRCDMEVKDTGEFQTVDHERWLWATGYNDNE